MLYLRNNVLKLLKSCYCSKYVSVQSQFSTSLPPKKKKEKIVFPFWALAAEFNPLRSLFDNFNLRRYRKKYDPKFDPADFLKTTARSRFCTLANAVAKDDLAKMQSIMTMEAFEQLQYAKSRNPEPDKRAWPQFFKLDPARHEYGNKEKISSIHFRKTPVPIRPADFNGTTDENVVVESSEGKISEIYCYLSAFHDDVQRKRLLDMGYSGPIFDMSSVFRPMVFARLAFGRNVESPPSDDWLITKAHFFLFFRPQPRPTYMSRVVAPKSTDSNTSAEKRL